MKKIKIIIDKDGNFQMEMQGVKGKGCLTEMEKMLRESKADAKSKTPTREFFEKNTESVQAR